MAIAWLRAKYNMARNIEKTLIISPVATLYGWKSEFELNAPPRVVDNILIPYMRTRRTKLTGKERAEKIRESTQNIIILNGDSLDNDAVVAALVAWRPVNLVLDEAHRFKSPGSERGKALRAIADLCKNRMIMTGTPILNSYLDLWAQFRIMDGGKTLGDNFFTFRETYFQDKNAGWKSNPKYFPNWQPRPGIAEKLTAKIAAKSSRVKKEDCLDLPPLVNEVRYCEMEKEQASAYFEMEAELLAEVMSGTCAATNALSQCTRMLQILAGYLPVKDDVASVIHYFKKNPKIEALKELLEELTPAHKVIVWATYKESYVQIRECLKALGLEWAELVGGTADRQGELDRFKSDEKCRVMLSNPQAGGVGVNGMQIASYAIYLSRTHSLGDRLQSEGRNHRGGSEMHADLGKITHIDLVVKGTLDEDVLAALLRKEDFSENILTRLKAKC